MAGIADGERDWERELAGIEHGYRQDTAACKNGGHRIHRRPDGSWADDDGDDFCLAALTVLTGPDGEALHEPVTMPRQVRPGAR